MFGLIPFERNELWNPFRESENEFFKSFGAVSHCRTDIKDEGDKFVLECEMPGFSKEDIQINIKGSTLTLCATYKADNSEKNSSGEISAGKEAMALIAEALIFRALMKMRLMPPIQTVFCH